MQQMVLATGQLSDAAVLSGPTGAGDLGLLNLQQKSLQRPYRVIGSTITLDIDLLSAQSINLFAIIGHSGSATATARVTAGAAAGASTYNSGLLPFVTGTKQFTKSLFMLFIKPAQSYRYWRIEISDSAAAYLDLGRLYVSNAFQPTYNMTYGFQQGVIDPSQEFATISGDSISLKRRKQRFVDLTLEDLTEDEVFGRVYPLDQYVGTTEDVLFVPDPDQLAYLQQQAIYGKIDAVQPNAITAFNRYSRQFKIKELLP